MGEHPTGCVECDDIGCPVEGMTMMCFICYDIICVGHQARHNERKHVDAAIGEDNDE